VHAKGMMWPDLVVLSEPCIDRDLGLFGGVRAIPTGSLPSSDNNAQMSASSARVAIRPSTITGFVLCCNTLVKEGWQHVEQ
jgi:hypothetical protein